ncbi:MAG: hypothetical protein ACP5I8_15075 [Phycisphaerae bacterium]
MNWNAGQRVDGIVGSFDYEAFQELGSIIKGLLVKFSTGKSMGETATFLRAAVAANHFGVMQVHNLQDTMTKKGVQFAHECLIFEVCQPQSTRNALRLWIADCQAHVRMAGSSGRTQ